MYTLHVEEIDINKKSNISLICMQKCEAEIFVLRVILINLKMIGEKDKNNIYIYIYI